MVLFDIARNTFKEAIRNRILYGFLFFGIALLAGALAFGALSVQEEERLTLDLGLAGISLLGIFMAVFVGGNLLYKEIERNTVYTVLPRPIYRHQWLIGKYLGIVATLAVMTILMAVGLWVVCFVQGGAWHQSVSFAMILIFLELCVIVGVSVFFSSFSTPFVAALLTLGVFAVGRLVPEIRQLAATSENVWMQNFCKTLARIAPNLRYLYISGSEYDGQRVSVHASFVDASYVGWGGVYAIAYVSILLFIATIIFSRREFS